VFISPLPKGEEPSPIIKKAKAKGVNKFSKLEGKTLNRFPSVILYQSLYNEVK